MYRLRAGDREPSLDIALKMAADLDVMVEEIFERVTS
jgi:DNA-binding XRE family transcriptional regulator